MVFGVFNLKRKGTTVHTFIPWQIVYPLAGESFCERFYVRIRDKRAGIHPSGITHRRCSVFVEIQQQQQPKRRTAEKGNCKYLENKDHSNYVTKACKRACCVDIFLCPPHHLASPARRLPFWYSESGSEDTRAACSYQPNKCVDNSLSSFYCYKFDKKRMCVCAGT